MQNDVKSQIWTRLEWVCRLALAGLFLYAAYPKIIDPAEFAKAITNYRVSFPVIGQNYVYAVAMFMPSLEVVVAIGLLIERYKRASSFVAMALMALFTVLILQAVLRGLNIDCGCFGSSPVAQAKAHMVGWRRIAEDVGWLAAAVFVYFRSQPRKPAYKM
ncbi:DoxX family membrane protein [bacterium]|nr:DoxX family membrane protein [bacterium]MBU1919846.1 DoxX family membrane protein [bacterium]